MFGRRGKAEQTRDLATEAWQALRADLDAVARQPGDGHAWVQLALRWISLATLTPSYEPPPGAPRLGFTARADGKLQDAALTERALTLIDQLLAAGHDPVRLPQARADLLAGWQSEGGSPATELDIVRLSQLAEKIAASVGRVVAYAPPVVWMHPVEAPPEAPEPRLIYLGAQLKLDDFHQLGWIENSWFNAMFQQRVLTAAWAPPLADLVVAGGVVRRVVNGETRTVDAIDVETWLSDGRFLTTTACRGRNHFSGGPWEDSLFVDTSIAIDELIALHRARLRMLLAMTPGLSIWPVTSAPAFAEMQEALRQRKAAFRLAEGLSETEARGIVPDHPEIAIPLFREAAHRACIAAATAATQAQAA